MAYLSPKPRYPAGSWFFSELAMSRLSADSWDDSPCPPLKNLDLLIELADVELEETPLLPLLPPRKASFNEKCLYKSL